MEAGISVHAGTDAGGFVEHGRVADEVQALGALLGARQALYATSHSARHWLRLPIYDLGGSADLMVYAEDPGEDLDVLHASSSWCGPGRSFAPLRCDRMSRLRLPSGPSLRARPPLVRPDPLPHTGPRRPPQKDCKEYSTTVAVKIKLARFGKIREPFYRIVVADARTRRSGRAIENIGLYHPKAEPSVIEIDSDRAQYWLGVGAQPTESVLARCSR